MNTSSIPTSSPEYFIGLDYHKRYSVYCVLNSAGQIQARGRIEHATPDAFGALVKQWPGRLVFEASMNWHWLYELLERSMKADDIVLANAYKTRIIAEAQVKTDKVDALILAQLLRINFIPAVHIPAKQTRQRKEVLRQRCFFVRQRTMLRNRIHRLLGGQHDLKFPVVSDLFGRKGMSFLEKLELPAPAGLLLKQQLEMLRTVQLRIKEDEAALEEMIDKTPGYQRILSIPGMGPILAAVVVSESDDIERFQSAQKLSGYAGLCPTTSSSGGSTHQGRLMRHCNKWLRWGFVEAAWVAVGCSPYFGDYYKKKRTLGKKANTAILATARRMARIAWQLLTEDRDFDTKPVTPKKPERRAPVARAAVPPLSESEAAAAKKQPRRTKTFPSRSNCTLAGRQE